MIGTVDSTSELASRTGWYINVRWFLLLTISLSGLLPLYIGQGWNDRIQQDTLLALLAIASNGVFLLVNRLKLNLNHRTVLGAMLLVADVALITYFIYTKGGIESRSPILYCVTILMSAALFGRKSVYLSAAGATLAYDGLILLDYFGIVHAAGSNGAARGSLTYMFNTIFFFSAIFFVIAVAADFITDLLRKKEHEARSIADALKRAQAIARLGSWEWDIREDTLVWSDELYALFDVKPGAVPLTLETYLRSLHPDDRTMVKKEIRKSLRTCKSFSFTHRVVTEDRGIRIIRGEGEVMTDAQGQPIKLFGTAQDITDERALDEAKNEFISLASHQLRTPATGVRLLLSLLADGYTDELTPKQREIVAKAYDANNRQLRIVDDLLNVTRIRAGKLALHTKRIDIRQWLLDALIEPALVIGKRQQQLIVDLPQKPIYAKADPERLYMVLDNIVSNASKYTPAEGTITVSLKAAASGVQITVTDTGIGISARDISRLFQRFVRLDNRAEGSTDGNGLGLYLAKNIMDLHGGTIKVRSELGVGTAFSICLPKARSPRKTTSRIQARNN